jgi:hypothetical protein
MTDNWKQELLDRYNKESGKFDLVVPRQRMHGDSSRVDEDEFALLKCLFEIKDNNPDYKIHGGRNHMVRCNSRDAVIELKEVVIKLMDRIERLERKIEAYGETIKSK